MTRLNDEDLNKVQGGGVDWKLFSKKVLQSITSFPTITQAHKDLINAIKNKSYIEVAQLAIPLIATDPIIRQIASECEV